MIKHEWARRAGYWECNHCRCTRAPLHKLANKKGWMYYYPGSGNEAGTDLVKIKCIERKPAPANRDK